MLVAITGCCLLTVERRLKDSYLAIHESNAWKWGAGVVLPLAIALLFLGVSLVSIVHSPVTDGYAENHAQEVFAKADTNGDGVSISLCSKDLQLST